jgi:hypothetical protein
LTAGWLAGWMLVRARVEKQKKRRTIEEKNVSSSWTTCGIVQLLREIRRSTWVGDAIHQHHAYVDLLYR